MTRKPHCWSVRSSCSSDPSSPFYRESPPAILWIILACGFACLVMSLVCLSIPGDNTSFYYFISLFLVLELVALIITCKSCICRIMLRCRCPPEYEEVSNFSPPDQLKRGGYGSLSHVPPTRHMPLLFVIGSSLPPLKPHRVHASHVSLPLDI